MHGTAPHAGCALRCSVPQTQQVVWRWMGCRKETVHRLRSNVQLGKIWQQKKEPRPSIPCHAVFQKNVWVGFFFNFQGYFGLKNGARAAGFTPAPEKPSLRSKEPFANFQKQIYLAHWHQLCMV